jgi:hypothetical protein
MCFGLLILDFNPCGSGKDSLAIASQKEEVTKVIKMIGKGYLNIF